MADISGYTLFLEDVRLAHRDDAFADGEIPDAYAMMSSFLEGIVSAIDPPFRLIKFEGDAAFAVTTDESGLSGEQMVDLIRACYDDFADRRSAAQQVWTCTCDACNRSGSLDLKFVVHHGEFFIQTVGTQVEALGPDINVAHRLLKNGAADVVDSNGYGLFTQATIDALALPLASAPSLTEVIDGGHAVETRVIALRA